MNTSLIDLDTLVKGSVIEAEIRAGLRAKMTASPLTDGAHFARNVEEAYRGIWRAWCASEKGSP